MKKISLLLIILSLCSCSSITSRYVGSTSSSIEPMPAPAPAPAPIPSDLLTTQAFVKDLENIKDLQYAAILLTNKWYTKQKSQSLCRNFIKLIPSETAIQQGIPIEKQFVTYWLITENISTEFLKHCGFLAQKYDFDESKAELNSIFRDQLNSLTFFKRIAAENNIRGPFIAIYQGKDNLIGLLDLNKLGETSIELLGQNWNQILNYAFKYNESKDPAAGISFAINEVAGLPDAIKQDISNNTIIWMKAGLCVTLVAASVISIADGGVSVASLSSLSAKNLDTLVSKLNTVNDSILKVTKKPENQFLCKAILEIANK